MTAPWTRRAFLAAAAASPAVAGADARTAPTVQPGDGGPRLKLSCNLYSFDRLLRTGAMSLEAVIDLCAALGFDAVDPTAYYFPGYPQPPADAFVFAVKRHAFRRGLAISGTGVRNEFTLPATEERRGQLAHVERWLEVASKLGAPVLRLFDGRGEASGPAREQMVQRVVEAFREASALGERHGVVIAYQNHDELLKTAAEVLAVRERVASAWFALNVDIGSLRTADPYEEAAKLAPFACTWQIKQSVYRRGVEERTDARRIVAILRECRYRGYLPLETLGEGDPREQVRLWLEEVRAALA